MGYPGKRVRRSRCRRRRRIRQTVGVLSVLLLIAFSVRWASSIQSALLSRASLNHENSAWLQGNPSLNLAILAAKSAIGPVPLARRVVYPYSVVPGGVRTADDLRQVSAHDQVVSRHYAGFDFQHAKVVETDQPKLVYLSYRIGNNVFWTRKKISLRRGEKLLTDGKITARTRCANQVSESAQKAISPEEPPAEKFEEPIMAGGSATQIPFPGNFASALTPREFAGFEVGPPTLIASGPRFGPAGLPGLYPPPIPSQTCNPNKQPCTKPGEPPPPPPVPEPATILLVSSGIAGIYWRRKVATKKHS